MPPLLIVKTGRADSIVSARLGDFEDWIADGLGPGSPPIEVCNVQEGGRLPAPRALAGAVVTGSSAMVTSREPWSERTANWLADAVSLGLPVLGICYGHQLLAHALGGRVATNPRGREVGTVPLNLTSDAAGDLLLGGSPSPTPVQTTHLESVVELPRGVVALASSVLDPNHAFRVGSSWGVQFHPEFSSEVMRAYLEARRVLLASEGLDVERLLAQVVPSNLGTQVLRRFADLAAA
jgi:GMP synthase (glutamine-hydrolysing)